MAMSLAGLQQVAFCDLSSLATTPAGIVMAGLGGEKKLLISAFKQTDIFPEKKGRNMENHQIVAESEQCTMAMLKSSIDHLNFNLDTQIVTTKQSVTSGSEDVFKYAGSDALGLDFKFESTRDKQAMTHTAERAFDYEASKTLQDAAQTNTAEAFTGISDVGGRDFSLRQAPNKLVLQSGGSDLFTEMGIVSRSLMLETVNTKNQYNGSIVDMLKITIDITGREADIAKVITMMNKNTSTNILWKEITTGAYYKAFDFNTNVLTQTDEKTFGDKDRMLHITYNGAVWVYNVSFLFGDSNGGATADTIGTTGGTMKIGY